MTEDESIALLYSAAQGEVEWRTALNGLTQVSGCWIAQFMGVDLVNGRISYSYEGGDARAEPILDYVRRFHRIDPHLQALMALPAGDWYHSNDHFDEATVSRDPFYQEFLIPNGDRYVSAMKVQQDATSAVVLGMHRALGTTPLDAGQRERLQRIGFHLQRATVLWQKQRRTLAQAAIGQELLDRLGSPVMLIDENRRIGVANELAQRLLAGARSLLAERGGCLACSDSEADEQLTLALRAMQLSGPMGLGQDVPRTERDSIKVRRTGAPPLLLHLSALRPELTMGAFGARAAVMVLVHDPALRQRLDPFVVANAYDLSAAESRVAVELAQGLVPKQIATKLGVSLATVRTQLSAIYAKLHVDGASDVVAMLNTHPHLVAGAR